MALVFGMTVVGCDDGSGSSDGGGSGFLGDELNLSRQVYLEQYNETDISFSVSYVKFNGNLEIDNDYGASGAVTGGKLSYSIGTPDYLDILNLEDLFDSDYYNDFTSSEDDVRGVYLYSLRTVSDDYSNLYYDSTKVSGTPASYSFTYESVIYVYVENDVTVSGTEKVNFDSWEDGEGLAYTETITTKSFTLELKAGWNAVYGKQMGAAVENQEGGTLTETETISMGNPSLRWNMYEYGDGDDDDYSLMLNRSMLNTTETGFSESKTSHQMRHNRIFTACK